MKTCLSDLSNKDFKQVVECVADEAWRLGTPIAILSCEGCFVLDIRLCRNSCAFTHDGSVIVVPDVYMIEMAAHEADYTDTLMVERNDGRCAYIFRSSGANK